MIAVKIGLNGTDFIQNHCTMVITKEHQPSRQRELLETARYVAEVMDDTEALTALAKSKVEKYKTDETYFTLEILPLNLSYNVPL